MRKKIVFTGGGTAGHVNPNIALIEELGRVDWDIHYIGSVTGIESTMITAIDIPYHGISCGKLRRYFSWENFFDPIKILMGIVQAYIILFKLKPDLVFSKGGFVAFPVVIAARLHNIPIIAHESDMSPGLANRLSFPFVDKICVNFSNTAKYIKQQHKVVITGSPIRKQVLEGNAQRALALCGFNDSKPCLLVVGGSQGANALNICIRAMLDELCQRYQVIHLCGKNKIDTTLANVDGYYQSEYAHAELADFFAASKIVISRAGANALYEILALAKPHILIPLTQKSSRGDQLQNARYFQQQGISIVVLEENLSKDTLSAALSELNSDIDAISLKIKALAIASANSSIIKITNELAIKGIKH